MTTQVNWKDYKAFYKREYPNYAWMFDESKPVKIGKSVIIDGEPHTQVTQKGIVAPVPSRFIVEVAKS